MNKKPNYSQRSKLLITISVMLATILEVLDSTIVNVALPHMQGQLGANTDQISWVLTSYLVSSAIFMPLTGYFTDILGRRKYLLLCIGGFVTASALCGISQNVAQIVLFRLLQGAFGAGLIPLSQAIMMDAFEPQERGKAMAIWGVGVMVGPVMGPTLGGWLTDIASWRWTFYINVPVGALSLYLASRHAIDTERKQRDMDWLGMALMTTGIGGLQYVLDRGNQQDWLSARDIQIATALATVGLLGFIAHCLTTRRHSLFDIRIFRDRNFAMSSIVMALIGLGLFGAIVMQPILQETLLGYPIVTTGVLMAPRGIASAISMMIVGSLVARVDPRKLVALGMVLSAIGSYAMTRYSLEVDAFWLVWPTVVQGLGMGLIFVPLSSVAFATLAPAQAAEAAGLFSLVRTVGSAIGISIVTTLMMHQTQVAWNQLGGHINLYNPSLSQYLQSLHLAPSSPMAAQLLGAQLARHAMMLAIADCFYFITASFVLMLPMVLLLRRREGGSAPVRAGH